MTDNTSIVLNNVSYAVRQGFFLQPKQIIKNLSFVIPKGVSFGLIGSNGAGKTTTIKLCTGIISPDFGEVLINGRPLNSDHDNRHAVGLLTENQYIPQYLTVTEWLSFLGTLSGLSKHELNESMSTQLSQFDLTSLADRKINSLSKGQVQRVGFAQAFLNTPQILFLDEPMSGLDPAWRAKIHSILLSFKKSGGTLLFSSHVISDVLQLSDMIAVINCGQINWQGTMADIMNVVNQYQVIVHAPSAHVLESRLQCKEMISQPDGSYKVLIDTQNINEVLQLGLREDISIYSFLPVYNNIEDLLS